MLLWISKISRRESSTTDCLEIANMQSVDEIASYICNARPSKPTAPRYTVSWEDRFVSTIHAENKP
jgi:hypothetical protein